MVITSNGTWFKQGTEIKPLYLFDSIMLVVGVVEHDKELVLDEELCSIEEIVIDGEQAKDIDKEKLYEIIDEYDKIKENEESMVNYIKNKYGLD
jgi:hypothetical protein